MPGGGGQSGGMVVGGPSPQAAMMSGILNTQAAATAAQAAKDQTNQAINLIRDQYSQAFQTLKPYTSEGISALSQLNQYMGLPGYNPGTAPTAPEAPTIDSLMSKVTDYNISDYINRHLVQTGESRYGYSGAWNKDGVQHATGSQWTSNPTTFANPAGFLMTQDQIREGARQAYAEEQLPGAQEAYKSQLDVYNQQMDLYNQALDQYNQDTAAGPMTPEQVQEKLMAQPGVGFQYNQGLDAIQRAASSKGMLGSGRLLQSLVDYGQGMASQEYGNTLSRLAGLVNMGQQSASQNAQNAMAVGSQTGQLTSNLGDTFANSFLAQGNALSQANLAANQQYQVIGGGGGGGGLGGIGSVLGGLGSLASSGLFSSKKLKTRISTPSTKDILDNVKTLEIDKWQYKGIDRNHIGPYAEDFKDKFGVGNGQSINIIDMMGVILGSVKELANRLDSIERRIK